MLHVIMTSQEDGDIELEKMNKYQKTQRSMAIAAFPPLTPCPSTPPPLISF